ncbi:MAG TPA: cytochrome c oxidase assembly protein [Caulobacteraceae bacterium]
MKRLLPLLVMLWPAAALAHGGRPPSQDLHWTLDPWLLAPLLLSGGLYALGHARLRRRSSHGRSALARQGWCFALGWLFLTGALITPLHEAGERSFAAHMLEHEILMLVAAPLLVLARPLGTMLWAFPSGGRVALGRTGAALTPAFRVLIEPVTATLIQAAALWLWHAPALFDLALGNEVVHALQHATFLVSALLFWSAVLHPRLGRRALGLAALCLFATSVIGGSLGALMAFAASPWYAAYAAMGLTAFGLTPTEDQQLAGLLMWVPGGLVHAGAALLLLGRALTRQETADVAAR